jgi:hypothetical protein
MLATKVRPPIDTTSLFSDPEPAVLRATTASPPPERNPFQAPDVEEGEEEASEVLSTTAPAPGTRQHAHGPRTAATR